MVQSLIRDQNRIAIAGGQSNADSTVVLPLLIDSVTGRVLVDATGTTVYTETPSGTINGSNVTFTTAHAISTIYSFAINGQYIHPAEYSIASTTITFVTAPPASLSGLPFTIVYS